MDRTMLLLPRQCTCSPSTFVFDKYKYMILPRAIWKTRYMQVLRETKENAHHSPLFFTNTNIWCKFYEKQRRMLTTESAIIIKRRPLREEEGESQSCLGPGLEGDWRREAGLLILRGCVCLFAAYSDTRERTLPNFLLKFTILASS